MYMSVNGMWVIRTRYQFTHVYIIICRSGSLSVPIFGHEQNQADAANNIAALWYIKKFSWPHTAYTPLP